MVRMMIKLCPTTSDFKWRQCSLTDQIGWEEAIIRSYVFVLGALHVVYVVARIVKEPAMLLDHQELARHRRLTCMMYPIGPTVSNSIMPCTRAV